MRVFYIRAVYSVLFPTCDRLGTKGILLPRRIRKLHENETLKLIANMHRKEGFRLCLSKRWLVLFYELIPNFATNVQPNKPHHTRIQFQCFTFNSTKLLNSIERDQTRCPIGSVPTVIFYGKP